MLNPYKIKYNITIPRLKGGWSSRRWQRLRRSKLFKKIYWYAYFWKDPAKISDIYMMKKRAVKKIKKVAFVTTEMIGENKDIVFESCISREDGSYIGNPLDTFCFIEYYKIDKFYSHSTNPFNLSNVEKAKKLLSKNQKRGVASVGYSTKKKMWWGWSHRVMWHFKVGEKIKYNDDLLILKNGWIEGSPNYKRDQKDIEKVKSWFKNDILEIKDDKMAWFLAKRFSDSVA